MTRTEIENSIKEIKSKQFFLNMKDHWNFSDYERDRNYTREIKELEESLKNL